MKVIHIILSSTIYCVPIITVCNTIIVTSHISIRRIYMDSIGIFMANILPPVIISMSCVPSIPRIITNFGTTMQITRSNKTMVFGKIHKSECFGLPCVAIRMRSVFRIRIIPVKVNSIRIIASCSIYTTISTCISSIRICERIYPNLIIIDHISKPCINTIIR